MTRMAAPDFLTLQERSIDQHAEAAVQQLSACGIWDPDLMTLRNGAACDNLKEYVEGRAGQSTIHRLITAAVLGNEASIGRQQGGDEKLRVLTYARHPGYASLELPMITVTLPPKDTAGQ